MRFLVFLVINFAALGLGVFLIGNPGDNIWYQSLNKAPWTPPGWVFGVAWFTIMLCFSFYMYYVSKKLNPNSVKSFYVLFVIQLILNIIWNPIFFKWHFVLSGLVVIILLTLLVAWFTYYGFKNNSWLGLWALPYIVWLLIATSLNAYIFLKN
jgi:tryptophan-rich sensory protein